MKSEIEKWLDNNAGWCAPLEARMNTAACKKRRSNPDLKIRCQGCKGLVPYAK